MNYTKEKIDWENFTLYLHKCPTCGNKNRKFDIRKFAGSACFSIAGIAGLFIAGPSILGNLAVVGVLQLLIAGTITLPFAIKILELNYKALAYLSKKKIFCCQKCGDTKLILIKIT